MFFVCIFLFAISFVPCSAMKQNCVDPYLPTIEEYRVDHKPLYFLSQRKSIDGRLIKVRCLDDDAVIPAQTDKRLVASHQLYKTFNTNDKKSITQSSLHNMPLSIDIDAFMAVAQLVDGHAPAKPTYKLLEGLDYFGNPNDLVQVYTPHDLYKVYTTLQDDTGEEKEKKEKAKQYLAHMAIVCDDTRNFTCKKVCTNALIGSFTGPANTVYVPFEPLAIAIKNLKSCHLTHLLLCNLPPLCKENNPLPKILEALPHLKRLEIKNSCIPVTPKGTFVGLPEDCMVHLMGNKITMIEKGAVAARSGICVALGDNPLTLESKKNVRADMQTFSYVYYASHVMKHLDKMRLQELLGNNIFNPQMRLISTTYRTTAITLCAAYAIVAFMEHMSIPEIISKLGRANIQGLLGMLLVFNTTSHFSNNYTGVKLPHVYFDDQDPH